MVKIQKEQGNYIVNIPKTASFSPVFFDELKFQLLAESWKEESRFVSFAHISTQLPSYQAIIDMGNSALPFIFYRNGRRTESLVCGTENNCRRKSCFA